MVRRAAKPQVGFLLPVTTLSGGDIFFKEMPVKTKQKWHWVPLGMAWFRLEFLPTPRDTCVPSFFFLIKRDIMPQSTVCHYIAPLTALLPVAYLWERKSPQPATAATWDNTIFLLILSCSLFYYIQLNLTLLSSTGSSLVIWSLELFNNIDPQSSLPQAKNFQYLAFYFFSEISSYFLLPSFTSFLKCCKISTFIFKTNPVSDSFSLEAPKRSQWREMNQNHILPPPQEDCHCGDHYCCLLSPGFWIGSWGPAQGATFSPMTFFLLFSASSCYIQGGR